MMHIPCDMKMFGSPQNWDASPGKHNLIDFAKRPARRTQKRQSCFLNQVAECLHETSCIQKAFRTIQPPKPPMATNTMDSDGMRIQARYNQSWWAITLPLSTFKRVAGCSIIGIAFRLWLLLNSILSSYIGSKKRWLM